MSKLSLKPQQVTPTVWYYEEQGGIEIYHEIRDDKDIFKKTCKLKIPWRKLRASLKRKDAQK